MRLWEARQRGVYIQPITDLSLAISLDEVCDVSRDVVGFHVFPARSAVMLFVSHLPWILVGRRLRRNWRILRKADLTISRSIHGCAARFCFWRAAIAAAGM